MISIIVIVAVVLVFAELYYFMFYSDVDGFLKSVMSSIVSLAMGVLLSLVYIVLPTLIIGDRSIVWGDILYIGGAIFALSIYSLINWGISYYINSRGEGG